MCIVLEADFSGEALNPGDPTVVIEDVPQLLGDFVGSCLHELENEGDL